VHPADVAVARSGTAASGRARAAPAAAGPSTTCETCDSEISGPGQQRGDGGGDQRVRPAGRPPAPAAARWRRGSGPSGSSGATRRCTASAAAGTEVAPSSTSGVLLPHRDLEHREPRVRRQLRAHLPAGSSRSGRSAPSARPQPSRGPRPPAPPRPWCCRDARRGGSPPRARPPRSPPPGTRGAPPRTRAAGRRRCRSAAPARRSLVTSTSARPASQSTTGLQHLRDVPLDPRDAHLQQQARATPRSPTKSCSGRVPGSNRRASSCGSQRSPAGRAGRRRPAHPRPPDGPRLQARDQLAADVEEPGPQR
jgi:hypothetical protein